MASQFRVDTSQALKGLDKLNREAMIWTKIGLTGMSDALLVLSSNEVPLDESTLSKSGHVFEVGELEVGVSYGGAGIAYAVYQHEGVRRDGSHVIRNYQHGRKSKYLEDPLKNNLSKWQDLFAQELAKHLR